MSENQEYVLAGSFQMPHHFIKNVSLCRALAFEFSRGGLVRIHRCFRKLPDKDKVERII
jgi:hypothetical protein